MFYGSAILVTCVSNFISNHWKVWLRVLCILKTNYCINQIALSQRLFLLISYVHLHVFSSFHLEFGRGSMMPSFSHWNKHWSMAEIIVFHGKSWWTCHFWTDSPVALLQSPCSYGVFPCFLWLFPWFSWSNPPIFNDILDINRHLLRPGWHHCDFRWTLEVEKTLWIICYHPWLLLGGWATYYWLVIYW